jgi:hypothetical protein
LILEVNDGCDVALNNAVELPYWVIENLLRS